jgi:hypothetical protein
MLLQEQIFNEINHIPADKLTELYRLIHQFRLDITQDQQKLVPENKYPLRNTKISYSEPFEPVALADWDMLK